MAQKTVVLLEDDIDGSEAAETVTFSLDGVGYEVDLSEANASELREILSSYAKHSRRIGGRAAAPRRSGGGPARTDKEQLTAIRAWARSRGLEVNERGRIPGHIVEQYHASATAPQTPALQTLAPPAAEEPPTPTGRRRARKSG